MHAETERPDPAARSRFSSPANGWTRTTAKPSPSPTPPTASRSAPCRCAAPRKPCAPSPPPRSRSAPGRGAPAKERSAILRKLNDLMLANDDDLALHHDHRAGQAAGRSKGEIAYAASLHRMVRRGSAPRLRRHHSRAAGRPPHPRAQAAGRRHARPSRPGTSRPRCSRARPARRWPPAARWWSSPRRRRRSRRWPSPNWPTAPACPRACCRVLTGSASEDRRRDDAQPDRAQAHRSPARPRSAAS